MILDPRNGIFHSHTSTYFKGYDLTLEIAVTNTYSGSFDFTLEYTIKNKKKQDQNVRYR